MKFLLVGANFSNKGAQSMLFTCVDELKRRFPGCSVYFKTCESKKVAKKHAFDFVYYNQCSYKIYDNAGKINKAGLSGIARSIAKKILGRGNSVFEVLELSRIMPLMDCVIDISGYNLSSKWSMNTHREYFRNIQIAMDFNIPVYLFPQSFGPFNYGDRQEEMDRKILHYLSYPKAIFAREQEGYDLLTQKYGLKNVVYCPDLVLMNTGVNMAAIYKKPQPIHVPRFEKGIYVGIIPNMRSFDHGNKENILSIYRAVIESLIHNGRKVCLFRHSFGDLEACRWIKQMFETDDRVLLLENDFTCFEYDEFCKNFDYIIAARYHSIVHAYRNSVPCLLFGWAVKYRDLAILVGQDQYVFDISAENIDGNSVIAALMNMDENHKVESGIIASNLKQIRKQSNCFDYLSKDLN